MAIEITPESEELFLSSFAKAVGSTVENGRVNIPSKHGSGYVQGFLFGKYMRVIVRNFELKEEISIRRLPDDLGKDMILIAFHHILPKTGSRIKKGNEARAQLPSVTIATKGLDAEVRLPGNTNYNAINVALDAAYLGDLLDTNIDKSHLLKSIVDNRQTLLFEQFISPALQQTAADIAVTIVPPLLQRLFYKLKAEELVCYLLMELIERKEINLHALNVNDVKMLYAVKEKITSNFAEVPVLENLAVYASMSQSKLKRLFKQVFGKNIYAYYQMLRMNEASQLLKNKSLSVSEVGYALGFINLSHFTRVFEEHIGVKPKKYSASFLKDRI